MLESPWASTTFTARPSLRAFSGEPALYRTVDVRLWTDPKVRQLKPEATLLFLYFVTSPHSHVSGVYYCPKALMAYETRLSVRKLNTLSYTLSELGLIRFDPEIELVWVVNMFRYQGRGEKNEKAAATHLRSLHNSFIIKDFLLKYPRVSKYYEDRVSDRGSALRTPDQDQDQEQEQEQKDKSAPASADALAFPKKSRRKPKPPPDPRVKEFIDWFFDRYRQVFDTGYLVQPRDGPLVKGLLARLSLEQMQAAAETMFADDWGSKNASVGTLSSQINKWLKGGAGKSEKHPGDLAWEL